MLSKWSSSAMVAVIVICTFGTDAEGRNHHRHGRVTGCSWCKPGYRVVQSCTKGRDTGCAPCPAGTYLPHQSYKRQCYLCSQCGEDLYVAHACTSSRDTICDSCHTVKGPHNEDFYFRCQQTKESLLPHPHRESQSRDSVSRVSFKQTSAPSDLYHGSRSPVVVNESRWSTVFNVAAPSSEKSNRYSNGSVKSIQRRPSPREPQVSSLSFFSKHAKTILLVAVVILCAILCLMLAIAVNRWRTQRHRKTRLSYQYETVTTAKPPSHPSRSIAYDASRTKLEVAESPEEMTSLVVT